MSEASNKMAHIISEWWKECIEDERDEEPDQKARKNWKGDSAALRRARTPNEVVFVPAYHDLYHKLINADVNVGRESIAIVAGILSHVKKNSGTENAFPTEMGSSKEGSKDKAKVSSLRFRRLLAEKDSHKMYPMMIRLIRLMKGHVNLVDLANDVYWWNEKTRKDWAYEYYAAAPSSEK